MKKPIKNKFIFGNKNVFIYGLTGSGKDTLLNIIKKKGYDYVYLRTADTLKHIITESRLESFDELEISKRVDNSIRDLHNNVDIELRKHFKEYEDYGEQMIGFNRAVMIMNRKSWEFTNPPIMDKKYLNKMMINPILISDVRGKDMVELLLKDGWYGIFIDNLFEANHHINSNHETEFNHFSADNKEYFDDLCERFNTSILKIKLNDSDREMFESNGNKRYKYIKRKFKNTLLNIKTNQQTSHNFISL